MVLLVIFLAIGFGVSASHDDELDLFEKSGKGDGMGKRNRRESILGKKRISERNNNFSFGKSIL